MSLLNDMLQDLQQQPARDNDAHYENYRAQLKESGMIKTISVPWVTSGIVFITVLLLLLIFKYQFIAKEPDGGTAALENLGDLHTSVSEIDLERTLLVKPVYELGIQKPSDIDTELPVQPVTQAAQLTHAQQARIDELLALARQAIARDRLTSPFEDNAYLYYQEVLTIQPENQLAAQGILQLADRYLAMADKKLAIGNTASATRLLQRAQLVAPDYPAVMTFAEVLQRLPVQTDSEDTLLARKNPNTEQQTDTESVPDANQTAEMNKGSVSVKDPFEVNAEDPHFSLTPNAHWQDQQQAHQAKLLLQQAKPVQATTALEHFIANNSMALESTRLLLEIYCEQGQVEAAQELLASASYLEQTDEHYFKARLALINNQHQEAMALLEAGLPQAEKREAYRALLAGVYQKMAHYPQAASSYKRLLEVFGDKPAYWLGYALALDAMEQTASALQAYQRLSEYTELQTEVRQYIEQRIAVLQR